MQSKGGVAVGIVHERPGWWLVPEMEPALPLATGPMSGEVAEGFPAVDETAGVVSVRVRPMGPGSRFVARRVADACLNCGEWIHPGTAAWYDPDLDEAVCATCWPAEVVAQRGGGRP